MTATPSRTFIEWADEFCNQNGRPPTPWDAWQEARKATTSTLRQLVDEVKRHAYAPQFEHLGPLVLDAEALLAKGE